MEDKPVDIEALKRQVKEQSIREGKGRGKFHDSIKSSKGKYPSNRIPAKKKRKK